MRRQQPAGPRSAAPAHQLARRELVNPG